MRICTGDIPRGARGSRAPKVQWSVVVQVRNRFVEKKLNRARNRVSFAFMEKEGSTKTRRKRVYDKEKKRRARRSVHKRLRLQQSRLLDELDEVKAERDAALHEAAKNPRR